MRYLRRTLKKYKDLYKNPSILFDTCDIILFPNGENEIWIKSKDGKKGFTLKAGEGKAGLGLTITKFFSSEGLTITGNAHKTYEVISIEKDFNSVEIVEHNTDAKSRQFKAWYQGKAEYPYTEEDLEEKRKKEEESKKFLEELKVLAQKEKRNVVY